jgi:DNA polymerase III subunit delta
MSFNSQKALSHRVVLLSGAEDYLVRQALRELVDAAGFEKDDYDLEVFSGESSSYSDWYASACTIPFLAQRRGVVVRNVFKAKVEDMPADIFKGLPETSLLILVADEDTSDDRATKVTAKKKALEKAITQAGGLTAGFSPDAKKANDTVRQTIVANGRKIGSDAIETLLEMTGGSLSRALEELEKVFLFSKNETISDHDIRSIVVASREWNIWRMVDAMTQGNVTEALKQLKTVMASNKKPEDFAFSTLFPQISRQLRLMMQARICIDKGFTPDRVPSSFSKLFPSKNHLPSEKDFVRNSAMRVAKSVSLKQIGLAIESIANADAALKGMGTSFSPSDTIERLVFDLTNILRPKKA